MISIIVFISPSEFVVNFIEQTMALERKNINTAGFFIRNQLLSVWFSKEYISFSLHQTVLTQKQASKFVLLHQLPIIDNIQLEHSFLFISAVIWPLFWFLLIYFGIFTELFTFLYYSIIKFSYKSNPSKIQKLAQYICKMNLIKFTKCVTSLIIRSIAHTYGA